MAVARLLLPLLVTGVRALSLPAPTLSRKDALHGALAGFLLPRMLPADSAWAIATAPSALCDPAVSVLRQGNKEVTLVGTAHISEESAELVRKVIRLVQPDTVMLELDRSRAGRMPGIASGEDAPAAPSTESRKGAGQIAMRLLRGDVDEASADAIGYGLASLYKKLDSLGFQSGNEFVVAAEEAQSIGATILLGDRDVKVTLRRLRDALAKLLRSGALLQEAKTQPPSFMDIDIPSSAEFTQDNVMNTMTVLKQRENIRALASYMKEEANPLYEALIGERDAYMARSLLDSDGKKIVAVVGMAHMDGIERYFEKGQAPICTS